MPLESITQLDPGMGTWVEEGNYWTTCDCRDCRNARNTHSQETIPSPYVRVIVMIDALRAGLAAGTQKGLCPKDETMKKDIPPVQPDFSRRPFGVEIELTRCDQRAFAEYVAEHGISFHSQETTEDDPEPDYSVCDECGEWIEDEDESSPYSPYCERYEDNREHCQNVCPPSQSLRVGNGRRGWWEMKHDSSVHGEGLELVSPKLRGLRGLLDLEIVVAALRECGARLDSSCGLHIHQDATGADAEKLAKLKNLFYMFQDSIYELADETREDNDYCFKHTEPAKDQSDSIEHFVYSEQSGRYYGLNFQSLEAHNTVEFRFMNGLLDWYMFRPLVVLTQRLLRTAWYRDVPHPNNSKGRFPGLGRFLGMFPFKIKPSDSHPDGYYTPTHQLETMGLILQRRIVANKKAHVYRTPDRTVMGREG